MEYEHNSKKVWAQDCNCMTHNALSSLYSSSSMIYWSDIKEELWCMQALDFFKVAVRLCSVEVDGSSPKMFG
jgi:hypothetical protein